MHVFVTGSFGNIGRYTLEELLRRGYEVTAFDVPNKRNKRIAKRYKREIDIMWGDITDFNLLHDIFSHIRPVDAVIHIAFIIPPLSEKKPQLAEKVNVGGTKNLVSVLEQRNFDGPFVFASSVAVFGKTLYETPPISVKHPIQSTDHYSSHKIKCERLIINSKLNWRILRYSDVLIPDRELCKEDISLIYQIPLKNRVESVHVRDVAIANVNALKKEAEKKILIISGGKKLRFLWEERLCRTLEPFIGKIRPEELPRERFTEEPYYLDWYDTTESQEILRFQHHTFDDYIQELYQWLGWRRRLLYRIFRPLVRRRFF